MQYRRQTLINLSANCRTCFRKMIMNTRYVENGLALVGALFIVVAVAVAATTALSGNLPLDIQQLAQTSVIVASN